MRKTILEGLAFFVGVVLFMIFVVPYAIDKELSRQEAVRQWNKDHGYGP